MNGVLRQAGLWSGAATLVLAGHVAVGFWLMRVEVAPGGGLPEAMPVEIVIEAPDIPPEPVPELALEQVSAPAPDLMPDLAPVLDAPPPVPAADMPEPDVAEAPPDHEPPPPPPPILPQEVTEPQMALAPPPPEPLEPAPAPAPPPDAVALPMPADIAPPDHAEALPDIQPPPEPPPEPEPEPVSESAVEIALRPPARPDRPEPAPAPTRPAPAQPAAARPAAAPAPAQAAAPAPAPAAPSAGEMQSWQSQVQRRIARHMGNTRLPNLRGQVQANISISVAPNGAVSAQLASSTGNPDVDAALQRQAASMPPLPAPPGGQAQTLVVPVAVRAR